MTAPILLDNLVAYSAQLTALVVGVAAGARLLATMDAHARLRVWQAAFAAACALPLLALGPENSAGPLSAHVWRLSVSGAAVSGGREPPVAIATWIATIVLTGVAMHLGRLALGHLRIRRWCQRAEHWSPGLSCTDRIDVRVGGDLPGPVTVGVLHPVVLVPHRLLELPAAVQEAVLQHDALHAQRHDPLQVLATEVWRGCLWFHPAVWALTSRLELAREMALDRQTLEATGDRRAYAQALLAFGGASPAAGTAAFTHRAHISRRIAAISQEEHPMPPMRRLVVLAAIVLASATATAAAVTYVPMPGVSQEPVRPGNGVQLPRVIHEVKPEYTADALRAKVQGSVYLDVVVEADGSVGEVTVNQSLDAVHGLDQAAVDAAEQWRFEPGRREGKVCPRPDRDRDEVHGQVSYRGARGESRSAAACRRVASAAMTRSACWRAVVQSRRSAASVIPGRVIAA